MVAAVNSADEKMKAFTGELNKYISQAVGKNMNTEKLIKILQENAPNQVKYWRTKKVIKLFHNMIIFLFRITYNEVNDANAPCACEFIDKKIKCKHRNCLVIKFITMNPISMTSTLN